MKKRVASTQPTAQAPSPTSPTAPAMPSLSALRWVGMLGDVLLLENGAVDAPGLADRR
jgi:hypothetical protein